MASSTKTGARGAFAGACGTETTTQAPGRQARLVRVGVDMLWSAARRPERAKAALKRAFLLRVIDALEMERVRAGVDWRAVDAFVNATAPGCCLWCTTHGGDIANDGHRWGICTHCFWGVQKYLNDPEAFRRELLECFAGCLEKGSETGMSFWLDRLATHFHGGCGPLTAGGLYAMAKAMARRHR
jgi:hypothetical protein